MKKLFICCFLVSAIAAISLSGCGWKKAVSHPEAKGFIERRPEGSAGIVTEKLPFMYVWQNPALDTELEIWREKASYSFFVAPIGTQYLELKDNDQQVQSMVNEIAEYLHQQIVKETDSYDKGSYDIKVVDTRVEADLVLEIELTEVGFGEPAMYIGAFLAPVPGMTTAYDAAHTSVLACEGKITLVSGGELLTELYDRRIPKVRPIDLNKMNSKLSPLRDISEDWAKEFAESLAARTDKDTVKGEAAVSLIPW